MHPRVSANLRELAKGIRMGIGFFIGIGSMWAIVALAAATWGNLPTVSSGSGLTSTAWNDVVGQVNVLAGAIGVSGGNVGIGVSGTPAAKLDVNGDAIIRGSLTTAGNLGSPFYSVMPNDMSFAAGGSVLGSVTSPMPVGTYFYQIYGCSGQNNFSAGATGNIVFVTGGGSATNTDYFDNTNFWGGSCGYFRMGLIKITVPWSTVRFRIGPGYPSSSNTDTNPTANSVSMHAWSIF